MAELEVASSVSSARDGLVQQLTVRLEVFIRKGAITSSDIGTYGLGAWRTVVLAQVQPGVPVWQLGEERTFVGLAFVFFPGNVGTPETVLDIVSELLDVRTAN